MKKMMMAAVAAVFALGVYAQDVKTEQAPVKKECANCKKHKDGKKEDCKKDGEKKPCCKKDAKKGDCKKDAKKGDCKKDAKK